MKNNLKLFLISFAIISALSIFAFRKHSRPTPPVSSNQTSLFDRWSSDTPLQLTIETDLATLLENKDEKKKQTASISWSTGDSTTHQMNANLSPRGKTRLSICDFPPLKLKFDKEQLEAAGYAPYKSFKLVTHCNDDQQLVLKEYLTYKMYNQITENSFQVQLAEVTYMDAQNQIAPITRYAIVLENNDEMADRLGGNRMKTNGDHLHTIDADQYRLLTVFQYMIGNTDWNLSKSHNIKLVKPTGATAAPIPVPYDFDFAGIVDAPYAKPHPQLPIQTVTQRLFQWRGKDATGFEPTLEVFKQQKQALFALCQQSPALDDQHKTAMMDYLASFYQLIEEVDRGEDLMAVFQQKKKSIAS